jgi:hypothetical protein
MLDQRQQERLQIVQLDKISSLLREHNLLIPGTYSQQWHSQDSNLPNLRGSSSVSPNLEEALSGSEVDQPRQVSLKRTLTEKQNSTPKRTKENIPPVFGSRSQQSDETVTVVNEKSRTSNQIGTVNIENSQHQGCVCDSRKRD